MRNDGTAAKNCYHTHRVFSSDLEILVSLGLFFWLHLWHVEVSWLRIETVPQQRQRQVLNLLNHQGTLSFVNFTKCATLTQDVN